MLKRNHSEDKLPAKQKNSESPVRQVGMTRRTMALGAVGALATGLTGFSLGRSLTVRPLEAARGPWGLLRSNRHLIWPTSYDLAASLAKPAPTVWTFPQSTPDRVRKLLGDFLTSADAQRFGTSSSKMRQVGSAVQIQPDDEWLVALSPSSRTAIYRYLNRFRVNSSHYAHPMLGEWNELWRDTFGLSEGLRELTRRIVCEHDGRSWLCDRLLLLRKASEDQRWNLVRAMTARQTYRLTVQCEAGASERVADYWRTDRVPAALFTQETGTDAVHLLSEFAQRRVYQYPLANSSRRPDCFWTAANFFRAMPDDRFFEQSEFTALLQSGFSTVSKPRYGDIAVLTRSDDKLESAIHAAVYLAGDFVFTKNGRGGSHPWMISTLEEMRAEYGFTSSNSVRFYRSSEESRG